MSTMEQSVIKCFENSRHLLRNPLSEFANNRVNFRSESVQSRNQVSTHPLNLSSSFLSKQIHAHMVKNGENMLSESVIYGLIQMCLECKYIHSASMLFFNFFTSQYLSLRYLVDGLFNRGRGNPNEFLQIFQELHCSSLISDVNVLVAAFKISGKSDNLRLGHQIHALVMKSGINFDTILKCSLLDFYADGMNIDTVYKLFDETSTKSTLLWNKIVTLSIENESYFEALRLFREMQMLDIKADEVTISKVIALCGRLEALMLGKEIHGHVIRTSLTANILVSNTLITMYSKNNSMNMAKFVFDSIERPSLVSWNSIISCCSLNGFLLGAMELLNEMIFNGIDPDLVTWNCLISGHSLHGYNDEAFKLFRRMNISGLKPNSSTITSVLRSVIDLNSITFGKEIHGYALRNAQDKNVYIGTSLVDMYLKCGKLSFARALFDTMNHKNVITWNSIISGNAYIGNLDEALDLLKKMEYEGFEPNLTTWNGLISGFSMKGQSKQAIVLIRRLKSIGLTPNVVSWTSLISGCSHNEHHEESLNFFTEMNKEKIEPNSATLATILRSCASLALLNKGSEVHCYSIRKGFDSDIYVATALIDMYYKSGHLQNAHRIFCYIKNKNSASYNAMLMGFALYAKASETISLFDEMCRSRITPDGITFTALLSTCRNSGLVTEGWKFFDEMKSNFGISPRLEHYTLMVDLLARVGYLDEAFDFIKEMPIKPDASLWGALLNACRIHKNIEYGELAAKHLFKLEPDNSANYQLLMNLYAFEKRWEDVENLKIIMNVNGLKSKAGWSWIRIHGNVHVFTLEGKQHEDIGEIYFELYQLMNEMNRLGYVPDISCIVTNVGEEMKKKLLMGHTEKLAMTYGLVNTSKGTVIRVIKSSRMCNDCHMVAKFMSEITGREIYVKDGVRFHHFKNGKCSCCDYW